MESNRIICEFMGVRPKMESPDVYTYNDGVFFSVREHNPEKVMDAIVGYAKYNTDWNWLIPVIQKIAKIEGDNVGLSQYLNPYTYGIEVIHRGIVEYIKSYNYKNNK